MTLAISVRSGTARPRQWKLDARLALARRELGGYFFLFVHFRNEADSRRTLAALSASKMEVEAGSVLVSPERAGATAAGDKPNDPRKHFCSRRKIQLLGDE